jgi:hypothetical protein
MIRAVFAQAAIAAVRWTKYSTSLSKRREALRQSTSSQIPLSGFAGIAAKAASRATWSLMATPGTHHTLLRRRGLTLLNSVGWIYQLSLQSVV